jgi:hypothetical protein
MIAPTEPGSAASWAQWVTKTADYLTKSQEAWMWGMIQASNVMPNSPH